MPVFRNVDYNDPGHHRNPRMAMAGIQENVNFIFEYAALALTIIFISFALYKLIPIVVVLLLSWALSMALAYFYIYILVSDSRLSSRQLSVGIDHSHVCRPASILLQPHLNEAT
jgi:uncharacterized membrane protein